MVEKIPAAIILSFQSLLLKWFSESGRWFPWRDTRNPYAILLAEKLLQQTSVKSILVDIYTQLLNEFPSPEELSHADVESLREKIRPLGLPYRAKDLVILARDLEDRFGGNVPKTLNDLLSIYGVGDYSARAVMSFAYGFDMAVVDTNVARVLFRVFELKSKFPANPARNRDLIEIASGLLQKGKSREFNWAMIDLGAQICKPAKPDCLNCPLNSICIYSKTQ
jgi:A/G-specific adenine glycosylase